MKKATRKPTEHISDQIEKDLAASALRKRNAQQTPTAREAAALKRVESEREESLRWQYYGTIPKRHWVEMSGRSVKVINEQADRYGLPLRGKTIDLASLARAFHDFLKDKKYILAAAERETDPLMVGLDDSAGLERYRLAKAELAEWDLAERKQNVLSRDNVHSALSRFASIIRRMGDRIAKRFGPDVARLINDSLEDCQRVINDEFGGGDTTEAADL